VAFSSPRGGGALNSTPTTEKRNRAHTAQRDEITYLVITAPHESKYTKVKNDCETTLCHPSRTFDRVFCGAKSFRKTP
jgi:hypothetical protein